VHDCNPSTWENEPGGSEFEGSLGHISRPSAPEEKRTKRKNESQRQEVKALPSLEGQCGSFKTSTKILQHPPITSSPIFIPLNLVLPSCFISEEYNATEETMHEFHGRLKEVLYLLITSSFLELVLPSELRFYVMRKFRAAWRGLSDSSN
jgi:hypothetical protein